MVKNNAFQKEDIDKALNFVDTKIVNALDNNGKTAMDYAGEAKKSDIVLLLLMKTSNTREIFMKQLEVQRKNFTPEELGNIMSQSGFFSNSVESDREKIQRHKEELQLQIIIEFYNKLESSSENKVENMSKFLESVGIGSLRDSFKTINSIASLIKADGISGRNSIEIKKLEELQKNFDDANKDILQEISKLVPENKTLKDVPDLYDLSKGVQAINLAYSKCMQEHHDYKSKQSGQSSSSSSSSSPSSSSGSHSSSSSSSAPHRHPSILIPHKSVKDVRVAFEKLAGQQASDTAPVIETKRREPTIDKPSTKDGQQIQREEPSEAEKPTVGGLVNAGTVLSRVREIQKGLQSKSPRGEPIAGKPSHDPSGSKGRPLAQPRGQSKQNS